MGIGYDGIKGDPGDKGSAGIPGKDCEGSEVVGKPGEFIGPVGPPGMKGQKV